jgi:hypothetical protein
MEQAARAQKDVLAQPDLSVEAYIDSLPRGTRQSTARVRQVMATYASYMGRLRPREEIALDLVMHHPEAMVDKASGKVLWLEEETYHSLWVPASFAGYLAWLRDKSRGCDHVVVAD